MADHDERYNERRADGGDGIDRLRWEVGELKRWRKEIEELGLTVALYRMSEIQKDVQSMRRAFITFSFSVVGSAIVFALTVFALLGNKP